MIYMFKLGHNMEAAKNICCDATIDHNTVTICFKKFHLGFKNLDDQEWTAVKPIQLE